MTDISNSLVRARDFCACVFHKNGQSFKDFTLTSTLTSQKVYTGNVKSSYSMALNFIKNQTTSVKRQFFSVLYEIEIQFKYSHKICPLFNQQESSLYEGLDRCFPQGFNPDTFTLDNSGKLQVLGKMLTQMQRAGARVVLVSNYTQVKQ